MPEELRRYNFQLTPSVHDLDLIILYANIRSLNALGGELYARISLFPSLPQIVCLTESWLNDAVSHPQLHGYTVLARKDSVQQAGGVIIFVLDSLISSCSLLLESRSAELVWILVHCSSGPLLLGCFYRHPRYGETASLDTLREEWNSLRVHAVSTVKVILTFITLIGCATVIP